MSMSTHVVGIRPATEEFKKMKDVWNACMAAGVPIPDVVLTFFTDARQNDGRLATVLDAHECVTKWAEGANAGLEVDLEKLPKGTKILRFYNSW